MVIAPWIGGYAGDGAAWVSWIGGVALMMLAGAAYIADEAGAVTETERIKALAKYQAQHGISLQDATTAPTAPVDSADIDQPRELVDALLIRPRHGADY